MGDQENFLHVYKHQRLLHVNTIFFGEGGQACPKYPEQQACNIINIKYLKKEVKDKYDFLHMNINIKVFYESIPLIP